jgi:hypothetical protein
MLRRTVRAASTADWLPADPGSVVVTTDHLPSPLLVLVLRVVPTVDRAVALAYARISRSWISAKPEVNAS